MPCRQSVPRVKSVIPSVQPSTSVFKLRVGDNFEKTPSNCLRAEYVARVLPEAKFILVVRDGRSVLRSSDEMQGRGINRQRLITRMREVPPWQWPKYAPAALETLGAKLFKRKLSWWGPKPAGWREAMGMSKGARLGWQWSETLRAALDATADFPQDRVLQFRYEDMMDSPKQTMTTLVDFCGFEHGQVMIDRAVAEADPHPNRSVAIRTGSRSGAGCAAADGSPDGSSWVPL